jgi:hypothetical protein
MELHIPRYALRKYLPDQHRDMNGTHRTWRDITFLVRDFPGSQKTGNLCLYEAHTAVAVCGISENRWITYCFEDTAFDTKSELDDSEFCYHSMNVDPIASNGVTNANCPFWNPREYFLTILRIRINQAQDEWTGTVQTIEAIIHWYTDGDMSFPKTSGPDMEENEGMVQTIEWTQKTLCLIQKLLETVRKTNTIWHNFMSPNGDVGYFSDLEQSSPKSREHIECCLSDINESFQGLEAAQQRLEDLEKRLKALEERYRTSAQILQLRLSLEINKASKSNGSVSELMVSAVSPVGIVSAFFAIPQPVLYFERNTISFITSVAVITIVLQLLLVLRKGRVPQYACWKRTSNFACFVQGCVSRKICYLSEWYYGNILQTSRRQAPLPVGLAELSDTSLVEI